jgi:IS30 family transposase
MEQDYSNLSIDEQMQLGLLRSRGLNQRNMTAQLGRSPSTASRELARHRRSTWQLGRCGPAAGRSSARASQGGLPQAAALSLTPIWASSCCTNCAGRYRLLTLV